MGHSRALAGIENVGLQLELSREVAEKQLSVRALEQLIKSYSETKKAEISTKEAEGGANQEVRKITERISHMLGTRVDIKRNTNGQGTITIRFNSDDEFNQLTSLLSKEA